MNRREEILTVIAITFLGTALRFWNIGSQNLWLDELFSVMVARRDWLQVIIGTAQGDTNPPLFNLLLHLALNLGSDEFAARAVSFVFSVATIPLFYALTRELYDRRIAYLAAMGLTLNPLHLFYAQEARMYAQLTCLALGAMFFFVRAWRVQRPRDWALFTLMMTLAFYTHSLAFLNLVALDLFVLTQRAQLRERWRALVLSHAAIAILFAPWLVILLQQAARVQTGFWSTAPSPLVLISTLYLFLFSNVLPIFLVPFALFAALALIVFAVIAAARIIARRSEDAFGVSFALIVIFVPLITLYALSFVRPIFIERTILPASLGLFLLLAWAITRAEPRPLYRALAAIILVGTLVALPNYFFNLEMHKPPMRDVARALAEQYQPGDAVAHTSDSSALAFIYYAPQLPNRFVAGDPDYTTETTRGNTGRIAGLEPMDMQTIVAGHARVWLVVALDHNIDYQKTRVSEFDAMLKRVSDQTIGGIDLLHYEGKR